MSLLQFVYFLVAAAVMAGVGIILILPPLRTQKFEQVFTRVTAAFAAKLLLGLGFMAVAWKVLSWDATPTAFGMVTAYVAALIIVTVAAMRTVKRGQG
ncbi:hypothetical protein KQI63_10985 [bacterium]|nr:hypothetical protein [bacterium]